jgi:hypothetical protein
MKKVIFAAMMATGLIFTSCKSVQVAKFTSVENVFQLKLGSSIDDVMTVLGSKPYNILSNQVEGYTIYTYKYKLVERKINPALVNTKGEETNGKEVYNGKEQTLFLFFKGNRLESFITSEGRKDSPSLVLLNNTLYAITKDKDKYIIVPTKIEDAKESANPFGKLK